MFSKLEAIVKAYNPNARIVSPTPMELMVEKWGKPTIDPQTKKVKDPIVAVVLAFDNPERVPASLRCATILVNMDTEVVVATSG